MVREAVKTKARVRRVLVAMVLAVVLFPGGVSQRLNSRKQVGSRSH